VRESGFWSVKFKHPLTAYQALSIAISIIHNPKTATLDTLGGGSAVAPGLEKEALALAVEARGAVDRPGPLKEAHDTYYKPLADQMMSQAISSALAGASGSTEELAAGLGEVLAKVGLGDRLTAGLAWAEEKSVTSLSAMHSLLLLQESQWKSLLEAVGPTKSYHKMRLQTQLKKMTDGKKGGTAPKTACEAYWAGLDSGIEEEEEGADGIEE